MLPQCSHITRKRGIYAYRRRLPRPHRGEIAISLGTPGFWLAQAMAEVLDRTFDWFLARQSMSQFDTKATLRAYLLDELRRLRNRHLATPYCQPVHAVECDYPYDAHAAL